MLRTHYVKEINAEMDGEEVTVCGWVHEVRDKGNIVFLLLRDHTGIVQVVAKKETTAEPVIKSMLLKKESVVSVKAKVTKSQVAKKGYELVPLEVKDLNPLVAAIPFEVTGKVPAEIDVRLDYRYIDLRRLETTAVFNIQTTVLRSFRTIVQKKGFQEIRTPTLVEEATEGGADLFEVKYFERKAYLAQSPQLYKQLAVIGGMDRVFMIMPIFRAEKHNTIYHINEITQMDIEMGFADHNDVIRILKNVATGVVKEVIKCNGPDLEELGVELKPHKISVVKYKDAVKKLQANGGKIEFGQDLTREDETGICRLYGDFVVVTEYPTAVRAFYSMPNEKNPEFSNSFDLLYKGMELVSGAQRIHIPSLLEEAIKKRGMNVKAFEFYINAMGRGAPPHAGWSFGLERFTMKLTDRANIREASLFPRDRNRLTP